MKLESLGYLVKSHGSTYEFYERPRNIKYTIPESTTTGHEHDNNTVSVDTCTPADNTNPQEDIEINNKYINNHTLDIIQHFCFFAEDKSIYEYSELFGILYSVGSIILENKTYFTEKSNT